MTGPNGPSGPEAGGDPGDKFDFFDSRKPNHTPNSPAVAPEAPEDDAGPHIDHEPIRVVMASLDRNIDPFAREAAHEDLAKKPEGRLLTKMAKSAWGNLTREYATVKTTDQKRQDIIANNNLLHHHGLSDQKWREATILRYGSEFSDDLVSEEAGETLFRFGAAEAATDPNIHAMRSDMIGHLRRYATGEIVDAASLEASMSKRVDAWRDLGISQKYIGEGRFLAQNMLIAANQAKNIFDSLSGLEETKRHEELTRILADTEIVVGEAHVGSHAEIGETLSERLAGKLKRIPWVSETGLAKVVGLVANETAISAMVSAGVAAGKHSVAAALAIPGLTGGIVAAARERKALLNERALSMRRREMGIESDPDNEAQAEMAATHYEARSGVDIFNALDAFYHQSGDDKGELNITTADDFNKALELQAEIYARQTLSIRQRSQLISFDEIEAEGVQHARFELSVANAKLKADLTRLAAQDVDIQDAFEMQPDETYQDLLDYQQNIAMGELAGEMKKADRLFNKIVRNRVFGRFVGGTLMGAGIGLGVHEGAHLVAEGMSSAMNLGGPENTLSSAGLATTGLGLHTEIPTPSDLPSATGSSPEIHVQIGNAEVLKLTDTSRMTVPDGFTAEVSNGQLTLTGPGGEVYSNLGINPDGSLPSDTQDVLSEANFKIVDTQELVNGQPEVTHPDVSAVDYFQHHKDELTTIDHRTWEVDGNQQAEFTLSNSRDANGNIVVTVRGAGGSLNGSSGMDWQKAFAAGQVKGYASIAQGSQAHAFEFNFGPDGKQVIDKNSPLAALFGPGPDAEFKGGFEEVSLDLGTNADGGHDITTLATVVGSDSKTFTDTVQTPTFSTAHSYVLTQVQAPGMADSAYASTGQPATSSEFFVNPPLGRRSFGQSKGAGTSPAPAAPPASPSTPAVAAPNTSSGPGPAAPPANPAASPSSGNRVAGGGDVMSHVDAASIAGWSDSWIKEFRGVVADRQRRVAQSGESDSRYQRRLLKVAQGRLIDRLAREMKDAKDPDQERSLREFRGAVKGLKLK